MLDLCSQTGTVDDIAVCIVSHFDVPVTNTALLSFLGYASAYHHTNKLPDIFFNFCISLVVFTFHIHGIL
jgi:hypothetical protein